MNRSWFIVLIGIGIYYGIKAIFQLGFAIVYGFVELMNHLWAIIAGESDDE